MKSFSKLMAVICLSLFLTNTYGACTSSLRYINGVWNKDPANSLTVKTLLTTSLSSDSRICVNDSLFNPSQGYLADIAETYELKRSVEDGFWTSLKNTFISSLIQAFNNSAAAFGASDLYRLENDQVLAEMYVKVKSDLDAGLGVILVAHSEGNLFALRLRQLAIADNYSESKIKIVHLAPPTRITTEVDRVPYFLVNSDGVISRLLNINQPNITSLGGDIVDVNHGVLSTYLNPDISGTFKNQRCEVSTSTPQAAALASIKRVATCQAGPCVFIGFSSC